MRCRPPVRLDAAVCTSAHLRNPLTRRTLRPVPGRYGLRTGEFCTPQGRAPDTRRRPDAPVIRARLAAVALASILQEVGTKSGEDTLSTAGGAHRTYKGAGRSPH